MVTSSLPSSSPRLQFRSIAKFSSDLLETAEVLRQDNTCVAGWIRVLSFDGVILVQEETPDGNALARRMPSIEDANDFVDDRLGSLRTDVGRMWMQNQLLRVTEQLGEAPYWRSLADGGYEEAP